MKKRQLGQSEPSVSAIGMTRMMGANDEIRAELCGILLVAIGVALHREKA